MAEPLDFETTIAARLQARAALATRPFDAAAIASAAVATRPARQLTLRWPTGAMRWAVLAGAAILAALAGALLAGALQRAAPEGLLAVFRADGIYLAKADGSSPRFLHAGGSSGPASWSADGTLLLVWDEVPIDAETSQSRATVLRTDGSVAWTSGIGITSGQTAWSHQGHRIAWHDDKMLRITDIDTGTTRALAEAPYAPWSPVEWSPDDTRILATDLRPAGGNEPLIVREDRGASVRLTSPTDPMVVQSTWLPDGRSIAVVRVPDCRSDGSACPPPFLATLDATTGEAVDDTTRSLPAGVLWWWSPDRSRLAWTDAAGGIFVDRLPQGDSEATRLDASWFVEWTPDGTGILAMRPGSGSPADATQDLWRLDADGSNPVLLVRGASFATMQPTP